MKMTHMRTGDPELKPFTPANSAAHSTEVLKFRLSFWMRNMISPSFFFFQAEDGIRYTSVTGVQTCALPICEVLGPDDPGVLTVVRRHPLGPLLAAYNVTGDWRPVPGWRLREVGLASPVAA